MKKVLCIILLLSMLLSFSSCASKNNQQNNSTTEKETTSQSSTTEQNTNQDTSITENNTDDNISDSDEDDIEDNEVNSNENSDNSSALKHYEVDLDLNNYETYLKYTANSSVISGATHTNFSHTISGVLTYAFYENVTITFDITYQTSGSYPKTYTGVYTVKLNAAGNAEFSADDSKLLEAIECPRYDRLMTKTFSIKEVSGKVMFAI